MRPKLRKHWSDFLVKLGACPARIRFYRRFATFKAGLAKAPTEDLLWMSIEDNVQNTQHRAIGQHAPLGRKCLEARRADILAWWERRNARKRKARR